MGKGLGTHNAQPTELCQDIQDSCPSQMRLTKNRPGAAVNLIRLGAPWGRKPNFLLF